eukprot:TRINITY_DN11005_c0_g3_i1.p1 TRINITY_DN11005_c0_g3~~TRINITY_DN11005_c0_g3_i1.p1  ORF type:complete len:184 (-),score=9.22 TRINITY_DN11005_c0_g3_i1:115-627(-)
MGINSEKQRVKEMRNDPSLTEVLLVILGCVCFQIANGLGFAWGGMANYIASYLRGYDNPERTVEEVLVILPASVVSISLTIPFCFLLLNVYSPRLVAVSGVILSTILFVIATQWIGYWSFVILFIIAQSLITGAVYFVQLHCLLQHFPTSRRLINGILLDMSVGKLIFKS